MDQLTAIFLPFVIAYVDKKDPEQPVHQQSDQDFDCLLRIIQYCRQLWRCWPDWTNMESDQLCYPISTLFSCLGPFHCVNKMIGVYFGFNGNQYIFKGGNSTPCTAMCPCKHSRWLFQNCFWLPSEKGSTLKGNNLLPVGANCFLLETTPFKRGLVYRKSQQLSPL